MSAKVREDLVEVIGTGLVVQQYRFEGAKPQYCKMVSLPDVLTPLGWTSTQVIWELLMEQLDGDQCRYTNTVTSHPTEEFHLPLLDGAGSKDIDHSRTSVLTSANYLAG